MGNHRFRLSDMMPNAWFYKLKDMSTKPRNNKNSSQSIHRNLPTTTLKKPFFSQPRYYSYNLTTEPNRVDKFSSSPNNPKVSDTHFPEKKNRKLPPMKKSERKSIYKPSPKLVSSSSVSSAFSYRNSFNSLSCTGSDALFFSEPLDERSGSCNCRVSSDIIIDVNEKSSTKNETFDDFVTISELEFPKKMKIPQKFILTTTKKVAKIRSRSSNMEFKPDLNHVLSRNSSINSITGVKLRTNAPKISSKKIQSNGRRRRRRSSSKTMEYSDSYAIVKCSNEPEKDFKESMMEMIIENNIRASKDLENLLACYLLLNSDEYHDLIVKAFEQIWFCMK